MKENLIKKELSTFTFVCVTVRDNGNIAKKGRIRKINHNEWIMKFYLLKAKDLNNGGFG